MGDHFVSEPDMPDGSWKCDQCNNINYPFRTKCNRQNCGAEKPSESQKSPSQEVEDNDQVCFVTCLVSLNFYFLNVILLACSPFECKVKPIGSNLHMLGTQFCLSFNLLHVFKAKLYILKGCGHLFINLHLSTVPVSTRTCLRRSRVVQQLISLGLKVGHVMVVVVGCLHVAAVIVLLYLWFVSSTCV